MVRLILASLGLCLIAESAVMAQMRIRVPPKRYQVYEKIVTKVENDSSRPVTLCVEFGQMSPTGVGEMENTPSPFWVQRNNNGKWGTLINGPDVGSIRGAVVLEAGESREFPIRSNDSGSMRLRLNYWLGSLATLDCQAPPRGLKLVTSGVFTILPLAARIEDSEFHDPIITATDVASFPKLGNGKLTGVVSLNESLATLIVSVAKEGSTAVLSTQKLNHKGEFAFGDLEPGEYLVLVTDSNSCVRFKTVARVKAGKIKNLSFGRSQIIQPSHCD